VRAFEGVEPLNPTLIDCLHWRDFDWNNRTRTMSSSLHVCMLCYRPQPSVLVSFDLLKEISKHAGASAIPNAAFYRQPRIRKSAQVRSLDDWPIKILYFLEWVTFCDRFLSRSTEAVLWY
jgi:hypothetical protein